MMRATRVGAPEYEMSAAFEYACKKAGARDIAYNVIISSAENHPYLHYYRHDRDPRGRGFHRRRRRARAGIPTSSISRPPIPANGKFTPRQREIYEAAWAVEEACLQVYRPGITAQDVQPPGQRDPDGRRASIRAKEIFKIRTMQVGISHNVGMAVHDVSPAAARGPLKSGKSSPATSTPSSPSENLGVRVEDTVVITETGCENLTPGLPRTVAEIEAFMKRK